MTTRKQLTDSYLARYLRYNAVDITDYEIFPERPIQNQPPAFHFSPPETQSALLDQPVAIQAGGPRPERLDRFLERSGTTAFLVVHHDRLLCERYYHGRERASICTSFSTVKSFVSALVGIALHEGRLRQLDDPLSTYLPELKESHWSAITIRHLVGMCSGLGYNGGGFFPWNDEPLIYYSPDLRRLARHARPVEKPGERFRYNNYNLLLLGMLLEGVTGGTVSAYLQEKIWKPLGMEFPASWSMDSQRSGMEKMESGLNARAIDFAKFGRLYLRRGDWNGLQVVPESWVTESTQVEAGARWTNYKYLWWVPRSGAGRFMAVGNLGQFIYVAPDKDCLILRFGRGKPRGWQKLYPQLFAALVQTL